MNKNEVLTDAERADLWNNSKRENLVDHVHAYTDSVIEAYRAKLTADVELPPLLEIPSPFPYQCHDDQFIKRYAQDYALQAIARDRVRRESDCTRSHPHEEMSAMCKLRTEIAQLTNENARLKADLKADRARLAGQEPAYWHVECDDPDYSAFFPEKAEALARISDHGGTITPYYAAPVPAQAEKVEPVDRGYREGWERGSEEGRSYKEAYFKLIEQIADLKAFQPLPPIYITPPTEPQSLLDALERIAEMKPDTSEATLAHDMADIASAALQEHGRKV